MGNNDVSRTHRSTEMVNLNWNLFLLNQAFVSLNLLNDHVMRVAFNSVGFSWFTEGSNGPKS